MLFAFCPIYAFIRAVAERIPLAAALFCLQLGHFVYPHYRPIDIRCQQCNRMSICKMSDHIKMMSHSVVKTTKRPDFLIFLGIQEDGPFNCTMGILFLHLWTL